MEFFFHVGSPGWRPERHQHLFWRLAVRFGSWADGPASQVFVERFDRGVRIRRLSALSEDDREQLIREATLIYEAVMFG